MLLSQHFDTQLHLRHTQPNATLQRSQTEADRKTNYINYSKLTDHYLKYKRHLQSQTVHFHPKYSDNIPKRVPSEELWLAINQCVCVYFLLFFL